MSAIRYNVMLLSLVLLIAAVEAGKILCAQKGAAVTGDSMVVLDKRTSREEFDDLVEKVKNEADNQEIHIVYGDCAKIITAKLSEAALEKVNDNCTLPLHVHVHLQIKDEAHVRYIEEEMIVNMSTVPWHLDRIDQRYLPLDNSYSLTETGVGVNIFILDTGLNQGATIKHDHIDLSTFLSGISTIDLHVQTQFTHPQ